MTKLRWGILSTARINRNIIPALKASSRNSLAAVASRDLSKAEAYAREWNIPRAFGTYEALLASPDIDVIYNSLPNHLHAEWTIKAAQAGKHVLCEKPFALSLAEVDQMIAAAQHAGVTVVEAFMYRHHPMTLKVRELIENGAIGEVRFMQGAFSFILNQPGNIRWKPDMGGGSLWDIGCYPVSYARMVMGTVPVEMYASQVLGDSGVDMSFNGQMRFSNGASAQVESSFELPYYTKIEIRGTEGTIIVPTITLQQGDKLETQKFNFPYLYLGEVDNLAEVVQNHASPRLPLSETREMIAMLTGLYHSAALNRPVSYNSQGYYQQFSI
jgi:xylose dehydrogenase (NAD/NADP)